jgi:hypothetical protein
MKIRWDAVHHPFTQPKLPDGSKDKDELIKALETFSRNFT